LVILIAVDAVKLFTEAVPALNTLILTCCDAELAFRFVILTSTDADLLSKFVSLVAADDVNEFTDAVPALNALILTCCDAELTFRFVILTVVDEVNVFKLERLTSTDADLDSKLVNLIPAEAVNNSKFVVSIIKLAVAKFILVILIAVDAVNEFNDDVDACTATNLLSTDAVYKFNCAMLPTPEASNESNLLSTDAENGRMLPTKSIASFASVPNKYKVGTTFDALT
jgi:hypothetical protein